MRYHISPVRYALDLVLNVVGLGPKHSRFLPARDPESRMRFAQYLRRVQPEPTAGSVHRTVRLLGTGGAVSRGTVRHAPVSGAIAPQPRPMFRFATETGGLVARRRAQAQQHPKSLRTLFDALRAR
jgi:hypothetical protein